jgi:MerR family redox-sensitive transcriptional activator SoxR
MKATDALTVSDVARRSGFAASALRFYEDRGLLSASRTSGGQRRYQRSVLRRLAFIRAARNIGLSLDGIADALASLPDTRTPNRADWARLSHAWRNRLDDQILALTALRDGLDSCIGCGCCHCAAAPCPTRPTWPLPAALAPRICPGGCAAPGGAAPLAPVPGGPSRPPVRRGQGSFRVP